MTPEQRQSENTRHRKLYAARTPERRERDNACYRTRRANRTEEQRERERVRDRLRRASRTPEQVERDREKVRQWLTKNRPTRPRERTTLTPQQMRRKRHLERKYSITPAQFDVMIEAQGNRCAICDTPEPKKGWHVDHCHDTSKVRGILCGHCNVGIGHLRDNVTNLREAAAYLEVPICEAVSPVKPLSLPPLRRSALALTWIMREA
jgi:hypothetical protein